MTNFREHPELMPAGYLDQTAYCPEHRMEVFPMLSFKTGQRYWLCRRRKPHFLEDPNADEEGNWGLRNNCYELEDIRE